MWQQATVEEVQNLLDCVFILKLPSDLAIVDILTTIATTDHLVRLVAVQMPTKHRSNILKDFRFIVTLNNAHTDTGRPGETLSHLPFCEVNHKIAFAPEETAKLSKP